MESLPRGFWTRLSPEVDGLDRLDPGPSGAVSRMWLGFGLGERHMMDLDFRVRREHRVIDEPG